MPLVSRAQSQAGFTMIELLVALVVLSVGLLGVAGIQALGLRTASVALDHNTATLLAVDITERMRVNRTAFQAGLYDGQFDEDNQPLGSVCTSGCTPEQQAATDLINWYNRLMELNGASASISRSNNTALVTINWTDVGIGIEDGSGEEAQTFVYSARLVD